MALTERKKKILRAVVDLYIQTAEPVSSKTVAALPDLHVSSATVRNEMADLTELGYLEQPHTSAGRVPSPAGYRLYVDELMEGYRLTNDETKSLNEALENKLQQVDRALSQVGKLISQLTDLPAYAVADRSGGALSVRKFELLEAGAGSFILVLLTSDEAVRNKLIKLPLELEAQDLHLLNAVLNASLTGLSERDLTPEVLSKVSGAAGAAASLVPVVVDFTLETLRERRRGEVYLTGQSKLLSQPEYQDIAKAREVLSTLNEETIAGLPAPTDGPVQILVGPEDIAKELKDTSVVMTRFDIGDGMQGLIGVVGPQRMDYAQVTARLSYFAEGLGRMFGKNELPPPRTGQEEPQG